MADVELLPLPSEVRLAIRAYARACVEANLAPLQAENERLRAEVAEWKRVAAAQAELHGEAEERAERLAEALEMMVEMVEMNGFGRDAAMDTARAALSQENHND